MQPLIEEGIGESHDKDLKDVYHRIKEVRAKRLGFSGIKAFQLFNFKTQQFEGKMLSLKNIIKISQKPEIVIENLPQEYEPRQLYKVDINQLPMSQKKDEEKSRKSSDLKEQKKDKPKIPGEVDYANLAAAFESSLEELNKNTTEEACSEDSNSEQILVVEI